MTTQGTTERVGRYQLLEPIGNGPCGSVSRAKVFGVAGFERQFAVKRFHGELTATAALAQALSAAARAYGGLEHPRIARMSEFGVAQGTTFTAVEYVAGLDALRLVNEVRLSGVTLPAGGALALVSQAARAVGYAHGRGLTHLGLSPTNVVVTADGDVKITDFGILSATLPQRPIDATRLANRIGYLAPEQLANEATSAATDVFALGVLAYELVTGQRAFRGETAQQVAQSVMNGPPSEPPLPRPIVRVLQRCLARSPFERFPDARALADALDAALRVAPVPGTRKDIGATVAQTMDRLASLQSGELSGMVALDNLQASAKSDRATPVPTLGNRNTPVPTRDSHDGLDAATTEFVRPDTHVAGPAPLVGPGARTGGLVGPSALGLADAKAASTVPDLPRAMQTVTGLAPPPIPVPPGVTPPPMPPLPAAPNAPPTLVGIQRGAKPAIPSMSGKPPPIPASPPVTTAAKFRMVETAPGAAAPIPTLKKPASPSRYEAPTLRPSDLLEREEKRDRLDDTVPGIGIGKEHVTNEMPQMMADELAGRTAKATSELDVEVGDSWSSELAMPEDPVQLGPPPPSADFLASPVTMPGLLPPTRSSSPGSGPVRAATSPGSGPMRTPTPPVPETPRPPSIPPAAPSGEWGSSSSGPRNERDVPTMAMRDVEPKSKSRWIIIAAVSAGVIAFGVWFTYDLFDEVKTPPKTPKPTKIAAGAIDAAMPTPDGGAVAVAIDAGAAASDGGNAIDAGVALDATATIDAGAATIDAGTPVATPSDQLVITSTPSGARVYIDGADSGTTPLKQPGTADKHSIALLLPGHDLYLAQVDGKGSFAIPLKELTPVGGPAGIKVLKCKDKDRYYVYLDGVPTGMTCPTERIETEKGLHVVEVYDLVTETRRKFDIDVKDTRLSVRVKIDP